MAPPKVKPAAPKMLKEFHLFIALPMELQLMIWAFWRSDQSVIHHYMFMGRHHRFYTAYDTAEKRYLRTTAKSVDPDLFGGTPLDPMEYKILFTNTVKTSYVDWRVSHSYIN
jgi:hypothetical protein